MNRSNADHDVKSIFQKFPTVNVVLMTRNKKFRIIEINTHINDLFIGSLNSRVIS